MFSSREKLAVADVVYYALALPITIWVMARHGSGRSLGWFFLGLLATIRIVGGILEIVGISQNDVGDIEAAAVLLALGISLLLQAMLGLLKRLHESMTNGRGLPPKVFRLVFLPIIAAIVLAAYGSSQLFATSSSDMSSGRKMIQAAILIFLVVFLIEVALAFFVLVNIRSVLPGERRILIAVVCSIPFILVRLVYALLCYFLTNSSTFNSTTGNVVVQGFMSVLEEYIVVALYLAAGILAPHMEQSQVQPEKHSDAADSGRFQWRQMHHGRITASA